ncbi:outer membrane beta-barrel protein [Winogradskyella sp.]|uniref:outer membrane protein n=1 Tax=Winogradskyella sp. TaxID=1883156 RepID=UPI0025EDDDD1|nr:outer membrane beta-barrel protein [Winogradskyella sp.]
MIRSLFFLVLIFSTFNSFSQDSKFNVELSYPLPIDNNFIGDNYNGIIDVGFKFRFAELNIVNIGGSLNAGYFKNSKSKIAQTIGVNLYAIQPRIFAELNIDNISKLHPSVGLGYSIFLFKAEPNNILIGNKTLDESGLNLNLGLAYDVTDAVIIQVQYDFVKINVDDNIPDVKYNTNINILKVGLGYRF